MDFVPVKYTGRPGYRDRTALANIWQPGDVKLVPPGDARTLSRFAEFEIVEGGEQAPESEQAMAKQKQVIAQQQEQDENDVQEAILLTVQAMDKAGLKAYAEKYDVKLDARKKVADLRLEVANLVEQFGAR